MLEAVVADEDIAEYGILLGIEEYTPGNFLQGVVFNDHRFVGYLKDDPALEMAVQYRLPDPVVVYPHPVFIHATRCGNDVDGALDGIAIDLHTSFHVPAFDREIPAIVATVIAGKGILISVLLKIFTSFR